jgi:xylulokinase
VGTGRWSTVPEACDAGVRRVSRTRPSHKSAARYDALYPEFGQLYRSLKEDFRRIAGR